MSRPQVSVRLVDESHQGDLVDLWMENRVESGGGSEAALRVASLTALTTALERPDVSAFLAFVDDAPVGYLVLKDSLAGPLTDSPCTSIDQLFVSATWRRHGVARQLLAAAAAHADRAGFLTHELGDSMLVLPGALAAPVTQSSASGNTR